MSNEEKAQLNYLLTKLRCQIENFMCASWEYLTPKMEEDYEEYIDMINQLLQLSFVDGEE